MGTEDEKRKSPRIEVNWLVKIYTASAVMEAETRNISSEGIFLCCEEELRLGEQLSMSILPPHCEPIQVAGKIMWSDFYGMDDQDRPVCIGMCFVEIPEEGRRLLQDVLASQIG